MQARRGAGKARNLLQNARKQHFITSVFVRTSNNVSKEGVNRSRRSVTSERSISRSSKNIVRTLRSTTVLLANSSVNSSRRT